MERGALYVLTLETEASKQSRRLIPEGCNPDWPGTAILTPPLSRLPLVLDKPLQALITTGALSA